MIPDSSAPTSKSERFAYQTFVAKYNGATVTNYAQGEIVFSQGDDADAVYYIVSGNVKVTVISEHGKEAVISLLTAGDFFGAECLEHPQQRNATVTATSASEIARIERTCTTRALVEDPAFARLFLKYVLDQNEKLRDDLADQLFNSSEKRLARILLTLANSGHGGHSSEIAVPVTQEMLANMVGTTRSRINQFMTKFRKLGYIEYNETIRVHDSLLNIIASDEPHTADR
jgi:CRP/FNR family cyclic AMP-dependent transcriptional regulator